MIKRRLIYYFLALAVVALTLFLILSNESASTIVPTSITVADTLIDDEIIVENSNDLLPTNEPQQTEVQKTAISKPQIQKKPLVVKEQVKSGKIVDSAGKSYQNHRYSTLALPNDPYASQWWVSGTNLEPAWDIGAGATEVVIAIIDTGFSLNHEEFAGRWYQNVGETGITILESPSDLNCTDQSVALNKSCNNIDDDFDGVLDNETGATSRENPSRLNCTDQSVALDKSCNNIDDDLNGLVDDVTGWDFANFDQVVEAGETNPGGTGTNHGTMVAGIAAANGNNSVGIAGVNWTAKILPIQAMNDDSYGDTVTVARAIRYAAEQGADVISISLGTFFYDYYLRVAVADAIEAGSIVVAATGNDGCECMSYPANFEEVVAVGATDSTGEATYFSNWGENLDIVAPGSSMRTPVWNGSSSSSYAVSVSGTSFATPYVSGLLALAKSHQPTANWTQLLAAVNEYSDKSNISNNAWSDSYGFGLINSGSSLTRIVTPVVFDQLVALGPMSGSDNMSANEIYQCQDGSQPGAKIYQLKNSSKRSYTTSGIYKANLEALSYSSSLVGYGCSDLPGDSFAQIRHVNIAAELFNLPTKISY